MAIKAQNRMVIEIEFKKTDKFKSLYLKKKASKKPIEGNFLEPCQYYINDLLGECICV